MEAINDKIQIAGLKIALLEKELRPLRDALKALGEKRQDLINMDVVIKKYGQNVKLYDRYYRSTSYIRYIEHRGYIIRFSPSSVPRDHPRSYYNSKYDRCKAEIDKLIDGEVVN
jgi:hypothetical protein